MVSDKLDKNHATEEIPIEDRRRRIRKNSDGSLNQTDIDHNNRMYKKYFLRDNPWMIDIIRLGHATLEEFKEAGLLFILKPSAENSQP